MKPAAVLDVRGFRALIRAAGARRHWTARRDRFLFYLLGKTGLRISEALALTVGDLWLGNDPAFVRVRTLKQRRPVTDEVLLSAHAAKVARRYVRAELPRFLRRVNGTIAIGEACPLFPAGKGGPPAAHAMSRRNAAYVFRTYLRLAGLPRTIRLHSLRHFRGTQLVRETRDLRFAQQQLRHRDIRNVQTYAHTDPARRDRYLRRLDDSEKV